MDERANQVSGGIFLIGLALLFATNWWWPGIMFVLGAAGVAQALAENRRWYAAQSALWSIAIGTVFLFGFQWWLLLLFGGVSMVLGGWKWNGDQRDLDAREKSKNDESESGYQEASYRLGDDGELIPNDESLIEDKQKREQR